MSVPSFLYSALDFETQKMSAELASLGGGSARTVNMEVHCVVDDRLHRLDNQTIWMNEVSIGLREAVQLLNAPVSEYTKKYNFSSSYKLQDVLQSPPEFFAPVK